MIVSLMSEPQERLERLVAAVMAMPARYRALLARFGDLDAIDAILRDRCDPTSWSALERIGHLADAVHSCAKDVVALTDGEAPRPSVRVDGPRVGSNDAPSRAAIAAMHAAMTDLARAAGSVETDRSAAPVPGGDLVTMVSDVVEGALREAELTLSEVGAMLEGAVRRRLQAV